jgi:hypothetical protein
MANKASPMARRRTSSSEDTKQPYNKLIDDKQVILSEIVRKPSMPPLTVGYMRAGRCHR